MARPDDARRLSRRGAGKEELQSNTLRGELAGGEYGVLAHEGLEVGYSAESFDWGGTFYGVRVRTGGVGLKGLLPFSGRANEALVRVPCTVAGVRLPESVGTQLCLRIDTRRSSPPFSFGHQIKLDELIGIDGWSVWGLPKVEPDALAALVRLETGGGMLAVWATSSYWGNAMVGDIDAFVSVAEATIEETLAAAR